MFANATTVDEMLGSPQKSAQEPSASRSMPTFTVVAFSKKVIAKEGETGHSNKVPNLTISAELLRRGNRLQNRQSAITRVLTFIDESYNSSVPLEIVAFKKE